MNVLGWNAGECRLPLVEPSDAHKAKIEQALLVEPSEAHQAQIENTLRAAGLIQE